MKGFQRGSRRRATDIESYGVQYDQPRSPLLEGSIEKPESLVHSTEPGVNHRKIKRRNIAFLRSLLHLGQNLEGVSSAPRQPVCQAEGGEERCRALGAEQFERSLELGHGLARLPEKRVGRIPFARG